MATDARMDSGLKFENNWLPWITLRHFLSASLIRSLCETMVHDMSGGQLSLGELVHERLGDGNAAMETWLIRPKVCSTPLASHLQQYVQRIVWQNDKEVWFANESLEIETALPLAELQFAFNLSACDLLYVIDPPLGKEFAQANLRAVYDAISECSLNLNKSSAPEIDQLIDKIDTILTDVGSHLRIATLKHLGDLFCDRDKWDVAAKLHDHAKSELQGLSEPERLGDFALTMTALINQSLAAAATITRGDGEGQKILADLLDNSSGEHAIVLANAGLDEYATRVRCSEEIFAADTRSAALIAPLLGESHRTENAFTSWREKDFTTAETWFWSTLRRQTALGLLTASKTTKGHFASCLIDDLMSRRFDDAETFKLAIGLLIESESSSTAKAIRWSEELLDAYLDDMLCQFVIHHTEAHAGARKYRRTVAIVLFAEWTLNIGAGHESLATLMLEYLIRIGSDSNSNLRADGADFSKCFRAVLDIFMHRPEFRFGVREKLANVLASRIGNTGYWTGEDIALQLATACATVFTHEGLVQVVRATLALLEKADPSHANWVIVNPAIRLLGEKCVVNLTERDVALGSEIVREIRKFNRSDSNGLYAAEIIFALNRYPSALLDAPGIEDQDKSLVKQALEKASAINASNAVNNMMALLVAPRAAGQEAIARVLEILGEIVDSVANGKPVLSFGQAYTPVRYLVAYRTDICRESVIPTGKFDRSVTELCGKLLRVWSTAIEHPSIFAPLTLLGKPLADFAIVHNWVVASLELAESVDQHEAMVVALEAARGQEQLSKGISLGFATRHARGAVGDTDVNFMSTESRGAFYAAIGRRLSALQGNMDHRFSTGLLKNTLRHGPRLVDAAVFASILPQNVDHLTSLIQELEDYKARIGENRELSMTLEPLLGRWEQAARA